ncbi:MAG: HIRAN domain-containing protein [Flavobacteriales bacterium]|nr:HIRAN domain-containing protein [Flavobacteriales bacterium]
MIYFCWRMSVSDDWYDDFVLDKECSEEHSFLVKLVGVNHENDDGVNRQLIVQELKVGDSLQLVADPSNVYDPYAVKVLDFLGRQIGFLSSDPRDSRSLLRGEPVSATVFRVTGATNWFAKKVLGKKFLGVVIEIVKGPIDWSRHTALSEKAKPYDELVRSSRELEKQGDIVASINLYKDVVNKICDLTVTDRYVSAHRRERSPVDRLSLLLEKQKRIEESLQVINHYFSNSDPVPLTKAGLEALIKRKKRICKKLAVAC